MTIAKFSRKTHMSETSDWRDERGGAQEVGDLRVAGSSGRGWRFKGGGVERERLEI